MATDADLSKWGELGNMVSLPLNYAKAPIAEAILELLVEPSDQLDFEALGGLLTADDQFLRPEPAMSFRGEVSVVEAEVIGDVKGSQVGYVYRRDDGKRVVHAHRDRFIFSWLPPYQHWDEFLNEALGYWGRYVSLAGPKRLVGIGVRFVNRIELPERPVEIKDYIRIGVDHPAYLPQGVRGMFAQIQVELDSFDSFGTITTLLELSEGGRANIVLDIDVRKVGSLILHDDSFDEILRAQLQEARDAKNYVFEACITDATRGLIR